MVVFRCLRAFLFVGLILSVVQPTYPKENDLDKAKFLNQQVIKLYKQGRYQEAIKVAQQTLTIQEKALGPDHPDVATSLNNLALLYKTLGDFAKAEPLYKRALAIWEKTLGPEHPDVATSLNNLANLYVSLGDYAKAEPLYKRALVIREKALGTRASRCGHKPEQPCNPLLFFRRLCQGRAPVQACSGHPGKDPWT